MRYNSERRRGDKNLVSEGIILTSDRFGGSSAGASRACWAASGNSGAVPRVQVPDGGGARASCKLAQRVAAPCAGVNNKTKQLGALNYPG